MASIQRRIETLEQRHGITGEPSFISDLGDDDARFYRSVMARPGSGDFETFVRTLDKPELERLLDIHMGHIDRCEIPEELRAEVDELRERAGRGSCVSGA